MNSGKIENAGLGPAISEKDAKKKINGINFIINYSPRFFKLGSIYNRHSNGLPAVSGIYALKQGGKLLYVGATENLKSRFYAHTHGPGRFGYNSPFSKTIAENYPDSLSWDVCIFPLPLPRITLLQWEEQLIKTFAPLHNKAHYRKSWDTPTKVQELF